MGERQASGRGANRIGLVLDQILFTHDGHTSTDEVFIQFVEAVAARDFEGLDFCSRVLPAATPRPYELPSPPFRIVALPWYEDVPALCMRAPWLLPRASRRLDTVLGDWSLAVAFGLHPLTPLALRQARRRGIPGVLWLRGDLGVDLAHRLRGVRRVAALAVARAIVAALPRGVPVVSMGRADYPFLEKLGPVHVAYSSKFGAADVVTPARPPRDGRAARLLYVGRLAPEKGITVLIDAFARLAGRLDPAPRLTFVGADHHGSTWGERFRATTLAGPVGALVQFAGHVPFGPELLRFYDEHDVLVLPSYTEGFPQVLLEGMARGIPIVATAVGGVPRLIRDGEQGLLVPAGDAIGLAEAVARALDDRDGAMRRLEAGRRLALALCRERQVEGVATFLEDCRRSGP